MLAFGECMRNARVRNLAGPLEFGRRNLWDRRALDHWLDRQSGLEPAAGCNPRSGAAAAPEDRECGRSR
jgi:hypothetical protein